jgi:fructosamine-3-kinase
MTSTALLLLKAIDRVFSYSLFDLIGENYKKLLIGDTIILDSAAHYEKRMCDLHLLKAIENCSVKFMEMYFQKQADKF